MGGQLLVESAGFILKNSKPYVCYLARHIAKAALKTFCGITFYVSINDKGHKQPLACR